MLFAAQQAPGKAGEEERVLRVLMPLRLSLGAAGSPLGCQCTPTPQGAEAELLRFAWDEPLEHSSSPTWEKAPLVSVKAQSVVMEKGAAFHAGSPLPCQHQAKVRDLKEQRAALHRH